MFWIRIQIGSVFSTGKNTKIEYIRGKTCKIEDNNSPFRDSNHQHFLQLPLFSDGFKEICFPLKLFRYRYLFNISFRVQIGLKFRIRIQIQWIWILYTGSKGGFCSERKVRKENRLARCGSMDIVKVSIPLSCLPPLPLLPGALLLFPRQRLLGRKITIIRNYKSLLRIRISKDPK